ncbi:MAG: carboxylesterase family protein [Actinomycetia bacterium]|nr:carboxylesterase family protein [Actinomycetes bacterium]
MAQADPEVVVGPGRIRGRGQGGVFAFRGIPYARPPVGRLRFCAPEPPAAWDGVRDASAFGPAAPQPGAEPPADGADEWLTLNVWTPDPSAGRLPVMVWVHGGAYLFGSSAEPAYDGTRFAMAGTVLVTCNYRLGVEGFGQIPGAPANRGLLDLVAVLRWVADNIGAFGGDPGNVTVFGESAGAGLIAALLAMDGAGNHSTSDLFRRAIAQSVPGTFFSPELASDVTAAVAREAGIAPAREALAAAGPAALVDAAARVTARMREFGRWGGVRLTDTPFSPVVDGEVLPRAPWPALLGGAAREVELLTGHNRDEYRLFTVMSGRHGKITEEEAEAVLEAFAPAPGGPDGYLGAFGDADPGRLFEVVFSDWLFRMPTLHLAQAHAASGGTTYLYELRAEAPAMNGLLGSCHFLDVPLIFGPPDPGSGPGISDALLGPDPSAALLGLGDRMREDWIRFASGDDPGWSTYGTEHRATRIYDMPPDVVSYPEEASMRLWQRHQFDVLGLAAEENTAGENTAEEDAAEEDAAGRG